MGSWNSTMLRSLRKPAKATLQILRKQHASASSTIPEEPDLRNKPRSSPTSSEAHNSNWDFSKFSPANEKKEYSEKERGVQTNKNERVAFSVYRWNEDDGKSPWMENFSLSTSDLAGPMVLDGLHAVKWHKDSTLALRRSCREGVCGSCAVNVNGKNVLSLHHINK